VEKPEGKRPLGRLRHRWEDNIKMDLQEMGCGVMDGTQDSHPLECIIPDDVLTQFDPPDDEHLLLEAC
jgi:hypothetical protein